MNGPLQGVRVFELTHVISGPFAGLQLASLGADVIRVEHPNHIDPARRIGRGAEAGMGSLFRACNSGKRAIALDLHLPLDRYQFARLLDDADVLVENFSKGSLARLALSYEDLASTHPRLIYCSITGFGHSGALADWHAYDNTIQAATGLMDLNAHDGKPQRIGVPLVDVSAGLNAVVGILAALIDRSTTGRGQFVDVSMAATALTLAGAAVLRASEDNAEGVHRPTPPNPGLGTYDTSDGLITLGAMTGPQQALFCECLKLGKEFTSAHIAEALRLKSAAAWETILQAAGIPAQRVKTLHEAVQGAPLDEAFMHSHDKGQTFTPRTGYRLSRNFSDPIRPPPHPPRHGDGLDWMPSARDNSSF